MRRSKSGFTLVELLFVVLIIGILVSLIIVSYSAVQGHARDARRKTDIMNIVKGLELYYGDNNSYPQPSGTSSALGNTFYSSGDSSWSTLSSAMTTVNASSGAAAMDTLPIDPRPSITTAPWTSGGYQYAYTTSGTCGSNAAGQWYLLVWRYEVMPQEKTVIGSCTSATANTYYTAGASYYLFSRN